MAIVLTPAAKYLVVGKGYNPMMGAGPLRRALERMVESPLAEKILQPRSGPAIPSSSMWTTESSLLGLCSPRLPQAELVDASRNG